MSKNKRKPSDPGANLTGAGTAPVQSVRTAQGAQAGTADQVATTRDFHARHAGIHLEYVRGAEPIGTMPPPTTLKGAAKTFIDALQGTKTTVLLDKVGERLAFERTGTRLYELLMMKHELQGSWPGGPTYEELTRFHDEELQHFQMLIGAMQELGGDPTAVTPSADVVAVQSLGLQQILADARTTLAQALQSIHVAELADRDGWDLLIELTTAFGQVDLASRFRKAASQEEVHLLKVREWMRAHAMSEAGTKPRA